LAVTCAEVEGQTGQGKRDVSADKTPSEITISYGGKRWRGDLTPTESGNAGAVAVNAMKCGKTEFTMSQNNFKFIKS
jgi:hypothetical protein